MDQQLSENKLILLYIIREKENIKATDLSDFVLFRDYMDYFSMQNYIAELCEGNLIVEMMVQETLYYTLHPQGEEVVELFRARIPHSIREEIRDYAKNSCLEESPLMEVDAKINQLSEGRYEVCCQVRDYDRLVLDDQTKHPDIDQLVLDIRQQNLEQLASHMGNILEDVTVSEYPVIAHIKENLMAHGALNAMMSGSGPTVFALFEERAKAREAADALRESGLARQIYVTTIFNV